MAAIGPKEFCDHKMQPPIVQDREVAIQQLITKLQDIGGKVILRGFDETPNLHIAAVVSLADFRMTADYLLPKPIKVGKYLIQAGTDLQKALIQITNLRPSIAIADQHLKFNEQLNAAPPEILQRVTLVDLQLIHIVPDRFFHSTVNIALTSEDTIGKFTIPDLEHMSNPAIKLLTTRIDLLFQTSPSFCALIADQPLKTGIFASPKPKDLGLGKLRSLPSSDVAKVQQLFSDKAFSWLSDEQFSGLNFSKMPPDMIAVSFTDDAAVCARRINCCAAKQFQQLIKKRALPNSGLEQISDDTISRFPWDCLEKDQIEKYLYSFYDTADRNKAKVALVPIEMVHSLVSKKLVGSRFLNLLSDPQLAAFDYTILDPDQRNDYFGFYNNAEQLRANVEKIPQLVLNQWLPTLDPNIFALLSDDQIKGLDVTRLTEPQIETLFPSLTVSTLFEGTYTTKINGNQLHHCWERQSQYGSGFNSMSDEEMQKLMALRKHDRSKHKDLLGPEKVAQIQAKIPNYEELVP